MIDSYEAGFYFNSEKGKLAYNPFAANAVGTYVVAFRYYLVEFPTVEMTLDNVAQLELLNIDCA